VRTVLLLRHAKASRDNPDLLDFERPLAARGEEAAPRMGEFMAAAGLAPEQVLCSGARRAVETWQRMAPRVGNLAAAIEDDLYMASADTIIDRLRALPTEVRSVLLIGHNPGLEEAALRLCGSGKDKSLQRMRKKFPTCALAVIAFEEGSELADGAGCLEAFVQPRDL
jgi:phosphohistidine phosphatase